MIDKLLQSKQEGGAGGLLRRRHLCVCVRVRGRAHQRWQTLTRFIRLQLREAPRAVVPFLFIYLFFTPGHCDNSPAWRRVRHRGDTSGLTKRPLFYSAAHKGDL